MIVAITLFHFFLIALIAFVGAASFMLPIGLAWLFFYDREGFKEMIQAIKNKLR